MLFGIKEPVKAKILKAAGNVWLCGTLIAILDIPQLVAMSAHQYALTTWLILESHAKKDLMEEELVQPLTVKVIKNMMLDYVIMLAIQVIMELVLCAGILALLDILYVEPYVWKMDLLVKERY